MQISGSIRPKTTLQWTSNWNWWGVPQLRIVALDATDGITSSIIIITSKVGLGSGRPWGQPLLGKGKGSDTAGIGGVNSPVAPLGSPKLVEAVEPGLNDGLNGVDAN